MTLGSSPLDRSPTPNPSVVSASFKTPPTASTTPDPQIRSRSMAEVDVPAAAEAVEEKTATNRTDSAPHAADAAATTTTRRRRKGFLARVWNGIFRGRGDDYEKRLQYLSKEEGAVHARMKRRAQWWRKMARNVILLSVVAEVAAVIYAIVTTRSSDLTWQMRALRVLPMFAFPGLSFFIYTTLGSFIKMCERKDQKMLEKLRAERQAKIDELKEKTNYYTTQQLIQRYDLDPAAKAAAATVLASKLGAESGLKMSLEDESIKGNVCSSRSNDVELVPSDGLRNRKKTAKAHNSGSVQFSSDETTPATSPAPEKVPYQGQRYVEHYKGSGPNEVGWVARLAAMLVGEDPSQSYALICGNCHMHNGLARKEDFPYVTYYCPHCHAFNGPKQSEGQVPGSRYLSGNGSQPDSGDGGIARTTSNTGPVASEVEGEAAAAVAVQERQHAEGGRDKEPTPST